MKKPMWLTFAVVAAIVILIAAFMVISRAPVAETQGTAPSVVTNTTGAESESLRSPGASPDPREAEAGSYSGRGARGSGVEGVTSGGTTSDPPHR